MKSILWTTAVAVALAPAAWAQDSTATVKDATAAKDTATVKDTAAVKDTSAQADTAAPHIQSAYKDYTERRSVSLLLGYFAGNRGTAGVGPQGSPMIGATFLMHLGGPANAVARIAYANTHRDVVDPNLPKAQQYIGTTSDPLIMFDLGISADMTGEKLWHGMTPSLGIALGLAYSSQPADVGGYKFGTQFYVGLGGGIKYQLHDRWVLTANAWFYFWQLHYPTTYFTGGSNSVLPVNSPDKDWTTNGLLTLGITYVTRF